MLLKKRRLTSRILSILLVVCLTMSGFSVGQLFVSAAEITGYQDEAVVRFRNAGSGKYLNVHYGQNANEVNVYQWTADGSTEQKFRLRYNLEEDCYMIGAMCSSNGNGRVLDIAKSGGQVQAGCNVQIYNAVDPVAQQWQFSYHKDGMFIIFPMANQYLALTANGNSNGSSGGKFATSAGNVYLSAIPMSSTPEYSLYQLWFIEEVEPQHELETGLYRINNSNDKYITIDNDDISSVYQMSDPADINNLDELGKSTLLGNQLWQIVHLYCDYYIIMLEVDNNIKLCAQGNHAALTAKVCGTLAYPSSNTWQNHLQWKIIPNADGGYRIASKAEYNTTAMTVLYGSDEDGTDIVLVPYNNAPSQMWSFETITCPGLRSGYGVNQVYGHVLKYDANSMKHHCVMCSASFVAPQLEDYELLLDEDLITVFALQRLARLAEVEQKDYFVEACYKMVDNIRSKDIYKIAYGAKKSFESSDKQGNFVSLFDYNYTNATVGTDILIDTQQYDHSDVIARNLFWSVDEILPFPFDYLMEELQDVMRSKMEEGEEIEERPYTTPEILSMIIEVMQDYDPDGVYAAASKVLSAIEFIKSYVSAASMCTIQPGDVYVQISLISEDSRTTFIGHYRLETVNSERHICIIDENMNQEATPTSVVFGTYNYSHYSTTELNASNWFETGSIFE